MKVKLLQLKDFRNLREISLELMDGPNLIYGDNGQGKTNIIEAIWLFTGAKSFRGARDNQLVRNGEQSAKIKMEFFTQMRDNESEITLGQGRQALLNGVAMRSVSELAGSFCAVVFSPAHLSLIQSGPSEKRRFIDTAICQMKPRYLYFLGQYQRVVDQRNRLLKFGERNQIESTLDIWDERMASLGALIVKTRTSFLQKLIPYARERYAGISSGREDLDFSYHSSLECDLTAPTEQIELEMLESIRKMRDEDIRLHCTNAGPHRDDLLFTLSGMDARSFGSQGQQRSCVLAVKLAECELCNEVTGEYPVLLLDDVLSELDKPRRSYLLHNLEGMQSVLTCCSRDDAGRVPDGAAIHIKDGSLEHV